jgi:hypothetical protein
MTAEQEVPVPGPVGGAGSASIDITERTNRICYRLVYTGIGPVSMGGIYRGDRGATGPLVINLEVATNGDEGCVSAHAAVIGEIHAGAEHFYVNLHTAAFPDGAVRGQLRPLG